MSNVLTEGRHTGECIINEADGHYCREVVTVASGEGKLEPNSVVGVVSAALEATVAAKAGGNAADTGTLTLDATTPVLAGAKVGVYMIRCVTAATNGGIFRVEDPDGYVIGDVAVGATFADGIKFVISDGTQDFVVGEGFDVTVEADDDAVAIGKYRFADPTNVDGSGVAKAVLIYGCDATLADAKTVALVRGPCEVNGKNLVYDAAVDDNVKKATKVAELAAVGIVAR